VAYESNAAVYRWDRVTGTTATVTGGAVSVAPKISSDGRHIAFESDATGLVPGDTNGTYDVYVRDMGTGTVDRVSLDPSGTQFPGASTVASISSDGRYVAFQAVLRQGAFGEPIQTAVYLRDRLNGTTAVVDVDVTGQRALGTAVNAAVDGTGRYVVFESADARLVPGDTNASTDVFVRDMVAGQTSRISTTSSGQQSPLASSVRGLSRDGLHVMVQSSGLTPPGPGGISNLYRITLAPPVPTLPGAPTNVSGAPGDRATTVFWAPPLDTGGLPLTYTVTLAPGGKTCTAVAPATSCGITGLTNGVTYTATVRAANTVGTGPSATGTAVPGSVVVLATQVPAVARLMANLDAAIPALQVSPLVTGVTGDSQFHVPGCPRYASPLPRDSDSFSWMLSGLGYVSTANESVPPLDATCRPVALTSSTR
jgi:hypothetical protein